MSEQWKVWKEYLNDFAGFELKSEFPWQYLDELLASDEENFFLLDEFDDVTNEDLVLPNNTLIKAPSRIEGEGFFGENSVIGPFAYLRGGFFIGDNVRIGSTEIKHSMILSNSNAAHYSFIGDSVIGMNCNFGAGTKTGNLRLDEKKISIWIDGKKYETGLKKLGVIMEDDVKTGCNVVINPGTYIAKGTRIRPNVTYPPR
ncbi:hypothetical protein HZA97_06215 [Candidatus Woesearchaeota archaeon]|nr:hypothetical protein [Candidatus Woesearchaeota archaeon]